jgi:hypothetical protein
MSENPFQLIGENLHTSRIVLKKGKKFSTRNGAEGVPFTSVGGEDLLLGS